MRVGTFWKPGLVDKSRTIAYFSMEIGSDPRIATYSGGLGILAGDTLKACADLCLPIVGVTLLSEKGYFKQKLDSDGNQIEESDEWDIQDLLFKIPTKVTVRAEGRDIVVQAWEGAIETIYGCDVPIYYLDTNVPENDSYDRTLTSHLYGGDRRYRILQEAILGIGGVKMLDALGLKGIEKYHMNEGHCSFLTVELLKRYPTGVQTGSLRDQYDFEAVRRQCIFTTHTPVPAGHDVFERSMIESVFQGDIPVWDLEECYHNGRFNMTLLALNFAYYANAVSKVHGEVTPAMFPGFPLDSITNGVHLPTWTAKEFHSLFDKCAPGWVREPDTLRNITAVKDEEVWNAHMCAKKRLIDYVNKNCGTDLDPEVFTIGFARRATPYKRATLVFRDIEELLRINREVGTIQIVFAGKAHPNDGMGKDLIREIVAVAKRLEGKLKVAFVDNYNMNLGQMITSGVDVWLNTPQRPLEASGTSGMKAAANGVPNLSVLDGWWVEGCIEGVTGWGIGPMPDEKLTLSSDEEDAKSLYNKLEKEVLPCFYKRRSDWIRIMKNSIAFNAPVFNTIRMVYQYTTHAYFLGSSGFVVGRGTLGCVWIRGIS